MADPAPYARFPTLAGERLAFVADDDLWLAEVSAQGAAGTARRLTAGDVVPSFPRLSPDGSLVAFTGRRDGAAEAYLVSPEGGPVRRLTFWGDPTTRTIGWMEGEGGARPLVCSASGEPFATSTWARLLELDGGEGERLPYGPISALARGRPPGAGPVVLGVNQSLRRGAAWKRYRGGTAASMWIDAAGTGRFAPFLSELDGQLEDPTFVGERLAFLSDHEGIANLYSVRADGSDLRRHSDHVDFYARALSGDGRRLVYQCAGELHLVEGLGSDSLPRRLDLRLGGAVRGRAARRLRAEDHLGAFAPDERGRASLVELRGSVQLLTHREGPARYLAGGGPVRARLPLLLGRGRSASAAFVTDAGGEDGIETVPLAEAAVGGGRRLLGSGRLGRVLELAGSPDGGSLAVATHDGRVLLVEVATGDVRQLDRSLDGDAAGLTFSPDSSLLAWSHAGPDPLRQIRLARVASGEVLEATPMRFVDTDPAFGADGRHLAFLSVRTFDPLYDAHVFDLVFASATRPYLLALATTGQSALGPELGGRPRPGDKEGEAEHDDGAEGAAPVVLDVEGLEERVVALPVPAGRYSHLRAAGSGLLYLAEAPAGVLGEERPLGGAGHPRPWLQRYDLRQRRELTLVEELDWYEVSGDGRSVVVRDGKALRLLPADHPIEPGAPPDGHPEEGVEIDLGRLRLETEPPAEWRQMYEEAGRLMRDHFFVEDMAGVDWAAVLGRYRPLLERIATRDELSELLWEVQGELGTSHAYERPPATPPPPERRAGHLGADFERSGADLVVSRVLPAETSVAAARSPLGAAAAGVRAGDVLVAVDGRRVEAATGVAPLLVGTAESPVTISLRAPDGVMREVVVVPLADERAIRYQDWVAGRRRAVHELSGGRVGYLHVPDMVGSGWAELHRDLRSEVLREALVVDVRNNRGGHVSELVLEKLSRTVLGWELGRHRGARTYPRDAPRGPLVTVIDENAGSDGDIVTAAFKLRALGTVVGVRTWGGVVGIDLAYTLVDGTSVTQPRHAFWFGGGTGWEVENYGVDPDVEVPIAPQDWASGADPQLERAVGIALEELARRPAATPPAIATRPDKAPPPLPGRP